MQVIIIPQAIQLIQASGRVESSKIKGMETFTENDLIKILGSSLAHRLALLDKDHLTALRLHNGFYEGAPGIAADLYGKTLVLFSYVQDQQASYEIVQEARDFYLQSLPWVECVIAKHHASSDADLRRGEITFGSRPDHLVLEEGIQYEVDLRMNQDAGFYLDTRTLRTWLHHHSKGLEVLNTFAYTGSLGVAALAGGARQVVQLDRSAKFLDFSRQSAIANQLDLGKMKLTTVDFFVGVGQLKRKNRLFDIVILDPPFFSVTDKGKVDQTEESYRLINKIRPLVRDGGRIVTINNALFLSGGEFDVMLQNLGKDGYLTLEERIPVPPDMTGFPATILAKPPIDPAPFNHPTKIAVLKVKRKE